MQKLPIYKIQNFEQDSNAFYANTLSVHIHGHGFIKRPHKHDFYLAMLFTAGTGTHEIDFETYPVSRGAVFFLSPGHVHRWQLSDDAEGYIFFHTKEFYDVTYVHKRIDDFPFFSAGAAPFIQLQNQALPAIENTFSRILKEHKLPRTAQSFQTLVTLCDLLYLDLSARTLNSNQSNSLYTGKSFMGCKDL